MSRPLRARVLYDVDIQALLRVQSAVTIDADIDNEVHGKLTEGLSYIIRTLRELSDKRRGPRRPAAELTPPPGTLQAVATSAVGKAIGQGRFRKRQ